jgi:hypothetical protein
MSIPSTFPRTTAGKLFLVSGLSGGREVFLGKAIDEPYEERLALEGKILACAPQGFIVARPFATLASFSLRDPQLCVQHIVHHRAHEEALALLNLSLTHVGRANFPLLQRWIETACAFPPPTHGFLAGQALPAPGLGAGAGPGPAETQPFLALHQGFLTTAEQFRRALFHARQVSSTRELDKLAELEGDLSIEIGKLTNQIAVRFHQLVSRESELLGYLELFPASELSFAPVRHSLAGWVYLWERLHGAKQWAKRNGKVALVRELNALVKDGITGLNEVVLEHASSLDTLVTETFAQYGIAYEVYGELTPFAATSGASFEHERETRNHFIGTT